MSNPRTRALCKDKTEGQMVKSPFVLLTEFLSDGAWLLLLQE